jgi:hypothetical protein
MEVLKVVAISGWNTYYNGEKLIDQPTSKCLWGLAAHGVT